MQRHLPQDLLVSVLTTIVVSVLILSSGVESQQSRTLSNGPSGSSEAAAGDQGIDGRIADTVDDEAIPGVNRSLAAKNCMQCSFRDVKRDYRIQAIKADIMRKMRLNNLPNVTGRLSLSEFTALRKIRESYTSQNDSQRSVEVDNTYSTTISVLAFAQTAPPVYAGNPNNIFTFNFTGDLTNHKVVNATMGIFLRGLTSHSSITHTWILVYRVWPIPSQERVLIHRRRIPLRDLSPAGRWFTFNMKSHVEYAMQHRNTTIGFIVQASDGRGESLAIINLRNATEDVFKPYLEIYVRDRGTSRNQRRIDLNCGESIAESRCCRYPLTVDFEEFGWDWVILPRRYSAYYCSGECPFLYNQRNPQTNSVPQRDQCCSPSKVSGMHFLYYDGNMNVIIQYLPNLVVDQCGCS